MGWRSEPELNVLLRSRKRELALKMSQLSPYAAELPEDILTAVVEIEDLHNELQFVHQNHPDPDEPAGGVRVPLRPASTLNSSSIALPEPVDPQI